MLYRLHLPLLAAFTLTLTRDKVELQPFFKPGLSGKHPNRMVLEFLTTCGKYLYNGLL